MGIFGIVYQWKSKTTGKSYVGQTVQKINRRKKRGYSCHFKNAIDLYGWDDFECIILEKDIPECDLNEREVFWINRLNTYYDGYNSTKGGDGARGYRQTQQTKDKKKKKIYQYNTNGNLIDIHFGVVETEKKLKIRHISACLKLKMHSAGGYVWRYEGENFSYTKDNNRGTRLSVDCYDKSGKFVKRFHSINEAGRTLNINPGHISWVTRGIRKTAGGYIWKIDRGG